jgi:hypothetical protein
VEFVGLASLGTEPVALELATPDALKAQFAANVNRWDAGIKAWTPKPG